MNLIYKRSISSVCLLFLVLIIGGLATAGWSGSSQVNLVRVPDGGLQPQAAVDAEGRLHLMYFTGDPQAGNLIYRQRGVKSSDFSAPIQINDQSNSAMAVGTIRGGHMALGPAGQVHVAWMSASQDDPGMYYSRLSKRAASFSPQHNVTQSARHLDGGGSIAADGRGNVYVSWHAGEDGEASRQVWVALSSDGGQTFAQEHRANPSNTGVCGCCGMQAGAAGKNFYMLYRSATNQVHRDMYWVLSNDGGQTYRDTLVHAWELNGCPMSSAALQAAGEGMLAAWETAGQVYFSRLDPGSLTFSPPVPAPGPGDGRKHPSVVANDAGEVMLAWTEGTGWGQGGALAWQVYDAAGKPTEVHGRLADAVEAWSKPAAYVLPSGNFEVLY
jgi:hypothetical protein